MSATRRRFLAGTVAGAAAADAAPARATQRVPLPGDGQKALVLTGGVNRGAYQAGAIAGLVEAAGLRDGQPLDYDLVAGASIGAMTAYFVATSQYSLLRGVWKTIASRELFAIKEPYRKITVSSSGVATRVGAALSLAFGLVDNVKGIVDPAEIQKLLAEVIDPARTIDIPVYFTATNLTHKRTEVFVMRGTGPLGAPRQARQDAILAPRRRPVRHPVAGNDVRAALLASAALPVVFDPVAVPNVDDPSKTDEFIDGGIADNVPIDVARRCASDIDIIAVDPPRELEEDETYANALDVGAAAFAIMQARIIQQTVKLAYAESLLATGTPLRGTDLEDEEIPLRIRYMRPDEVLPGELGAFEDLAALDAMWAIGRADALRGWLAFSPTRAFG